MPDKPYDPDPIAERASRSADPPKSRRRKSATLVRSGQLTYFGPAIEAAEAESLQRAGRRAIRPQITPRPDTARKG